MPNPFSKSEITFSCKQSIKDLTFRNEFNSVIIFKIKVSSVNLISIEPNRGFIRANSDVRFLIKSISDELFETKVLFTYALLESKNSDFSEEWEEAKSKGKLSHEKIAVKRLEQYEGRMSNFEKDDDQDRKSRKVTIKENSQHEKQKPFVKKPRSKSQIESEKNISQRGLSGDREDSGSKQIFYEASSFEDEVFYTGEQMQELLQEKSLIAQQLAAEQIKHIKMTQQLSITEARLKEVTEEKMHIQVHKSIGVVCEDYHTSFVQLIVLGLACFVAGFFLGKIEAEMV